MGQAAKIYSIVVSSQELIGCVMILLFTYREVGRAVVADGQAVLSLASMRNDAMQKVVARLRFCGERVSGVSECCHPNTHTQTHTKQKIFM